MFFGLIIATILFNIIFFSITRNKSYVFLALHLLFSLGNFIFYLGFGYEYFHFIKPEILINIKFIFYALSGICHALFIIYYLELKKKNWLWVLTVIGTIFFTVLFVITISGLFSLRIIAQYSIYSYLISTVFNLIVAIASILKKNRNAFYYFIAFSFHFGASIVFTLTTAGVLDFSVINLNIQVIAAIIFGILLSIGLTEQFALTNAVKATNLQLEKDKTMLITEVEERKKVQKLLSESENKFRSLIELLPHPLNLTAQDTGLIIEVNKALCKVSGYEKGELIGKPTTSIGFWDFEDRTEYMRELKLAGKISGKQLKMKVAGEAVLPVMLYSEIVNINTELSILTLVVDISELKKKEEALENSEKKLIESNRTKDKFFSIIAHDLQNPLNVLHAYNYQLQAHIESKDFAKAEKYSKTIERITENTSSLIQNLLSWARIQTGLISYNPEPHLALSQIEFEIKMMSDMFDKKNIKFDFECPPELIFVCDRNMMSTIIRNLLSNALKFTERGGQVKLIAKTESGLNYIKVLDNGIGINEKIINKLFKIEELVHTVGTEEETGTGLGLILSSELIKLHQGNISVINNSPQGSIFTVSWPSSQKNNSDN